MSQETLNLIIGAIIGIVSSLLTQIAGYYFQRKNDERKRQWELEDKGIERKLRVRDTRIQELQAFLPSYIDTIRNLVESEVEVIVEKEADDNSVIIDKTSEFLKTISKQLPNIFSLNDLELSDAFYELNSRFGEECKKADELMDIILNNESFDKSTLLRRVTDFYFDTSGYLSIIQRRLDELAKTI